MDKWYYEANGHQHGPVSPDELQQKISLGEVGQNTLVWKESMGDWQSLSTAWPEAAASAAPADPYSTPQASVHSTAPQSQKLPGESEANTAMGLGIASIVLALCFSFLGIILGGVAIYMASTATKKIAGISGGEKALGNAKIGRITGIVGIVFGVLNSAFGIIMLMNG